MHQPSPSAEDVVGWIVQAGKNIKLGSGVTGKTGRAMLGVLAIWAALAFRITGDLKMDAVLIVFGLIPTAAFIWWSRSTQSFAERNPAQAMFDGAQWTEFQREKWQAQIKGGAPITSEGLSEPQVLTGTVTRKVISGD